MRPVRALLRGGLAGAGATVPMSAWMWAAQKAGLVGEQPPEKVTATALDAAGVERTEQTQDALSLLTHLGFGAGVGAAYTVVRTAAPSRMPDAAVGLAWALAVYAVSYKGWIPALGIMPAPERDRSDRQAAMVIAHVVYGLALARLTRSELKEAS